jgi:hypothetical protein
MPKFSRFFFIFLFWINVFCKSPTISNACDPNTNDYIKTVLFTLQRGDITGSFCGVDFRQTNLAPTITFLGNLFAFPRGSAITPIIPNVTSNPTSCLSNPSLPNGLNLDLNTCVISGTPTQISNTSAYKISASNAQGLGSTEINLGIHTTANNWIPINAPGATNQWQSIVFGNGQFVAVSATGTNRVITSPNGSTWTAHTEAQANNWQSVTYANGLYVAVSDNGANRVMISTD